MRSQKYNQGFPRSLSLTSVRAIRIFEKDQFNVAPKNSSSVEDDKFLHGATMDIAQEIDPVCELWQGK